MIGMTNLPPEVLSKIFGKLLTVRLSDVTPEILESWHREFNSTNKYRRVCKIWLLVLDDVMEHHLLSLMNNIWIPNRTMYDLIPASVLRFVIRRNTLRVMSNENTIRYPQFMVEFKECGPFAGNSLILKFHDRDATIYGITHILNDFNDTYARLISILGLANISLTFDNFINILRASKNLKVLIIRDFKLAVKDDFCKLHHAFQLPPLPKLKTLLLFNYFCVFNSNFSRTMHESINYKPLSTYNNWLFNSYAGQLQNLEIKYYKSLKVDPLPELKQLSIIAKSASFLLRSQFGALRKVERINISGLGGLKSNIVGLNVTSLFAFIGQISNTLVEVYLDIGLFRLRNEAVYPGHSEQLQNQHQFPLVHKLTLIFPEANENRQLITVIILPKFPNLNHLLFLRYEKDWYPCPFYYSPETPAVIDTPFFDDIWIICQRLNKISMLYRNQIYRCQGPRFSHCAYKRPEGI